MLTIKFAVKSEDLLRLRLIVSAVELPLIVKSLDAVKPFNEVILLDETFPPSSIFSVCKLELQLPDEVEEKLETATLELEPELPQPERPNANKGKSVIEDE